MSILQNNIQYNNFPNYFDTKNQITLYNGDCMEFLNTIPDESLQLIITSPPYNIGKDYEKVLPFQDYIDFQDMIIDKCIKKLKPTGNICWQIGNTIDKKTKEKLPIDIYLFNSFKSRGLRFNNRIIWHFEHGFNDSKRFSGRYETILWFSKTNNYVFNLDNVRVPQKYPGKKSYKGANKGAYTSNPLGKNPSDFWNFEKSCDVWNIPNVKSNHIEKISNHQCQFPIALIQRLILSLSNEQDIVFDPFMGLATTPIATIINNRKAVGCEINKEYFDISTERVNNAISGNLKYREDKPIYSPPKGTSLTKNPFI